MQACKDLSPLNLQRVKYKISGKKIGFITESCCRKAVFLISLPVILSFMPPHFFVISSVNIAYNLHLRVFVIRLFSPSHLTSGYLRFISMKIAQLHLGAHLLRCLLLRSTQQNEIAGDGDYAWLYQQHGGGEKGRKLLRAVNRAIMTPV